MSRVLKATFQTMRQDFKEWREEYLATILFIVAVIGVVIASIAGWVVLLAATSGSSGWTQLFVGIGGIVLFASEIIGAIWSAKAYARAKKLVEKENEETMRALRGKEHRNYQQPRFHKGTHIV